jgi:predicted P-loop ATPase
MFSAYAAAGFATELLPILPRDAEVSPASPNRENLLKSRGKVPGRYRREGWVGFLQWPEHLASEADVARWSNWFDRLGAGVGLQGRRFPALDIDVEDAAIVALVRQLAESMLGAGPVRSRGTHKCLIAYRSDDPIPKRSIAFSLPGHVDAAGNPIRFLVEFLGFGQQYLVEGTHPSGKVYRWTNGSLVENGPKGLALVTAQAVDAFLDALKTELVSEFGAILVPGSLSAGAVRSGVWQGGLSAPSFAAACAALNTVENDLHYDEWIKVMAAFKAATLGADDDPLEAFAHWSSTGPKDDPEITAAKWKSLNPPYSVGWDHLARLAADGSGDTHFGAKHEFDAVGSPEEAPGLPALPKFKRSANGAIEATADNLRMALERADLVDCTVRYDSFKGDVMITDAGDWRPLEDADYFELRLRLEQRGFKTVGKELLRDAIWWLADRNTFDTARAWLDGLTWDGTPRIERFFPNCFGVADSAYARAVGAYVWTAHAGRVLDPGCFAAMVPVLVGRQGAGKSRGVKAIAPSPASEFYAEFSFGEKKDDRSRKMRGCLVGELAELQGLRTRELEEIKAWISQTHENWIPKYKEMTTRFPRRLLLWGTSNDNEILADPTGERRWLPIAVGSVDVDRICAERDQLWAEGAHVWREQGVVFAGAETLAKAEHGKFRSLDPWEGPVAKWINTPDEEGVTPMASGKLRIFDILSLPLRLEIQRITRREEMRVSKILQGLGLERRRTRLDGVPQWVWVPK